MVLLLAAAVGAAAQTGGFSGLFGEAQATLDAGDAAGALEKYVEALPRASGPRERALAEHGAGLALWKLGKTRKARKRFERAFDLDPVNADVLSSLTAALDPEKAVRLLEKEVRRDSSNFAALVLLAKAYLDPRFAQGARAAELLERASALEGPRASQAWVLSELARIRREAGRLDEALALHKRLLTEYKDDLGYPAFFLEAAETQARAQNHEKARQLVRRGCALVAANGPPQAHHGVLEALADACTGLGGYDAAEALWAFLLARYPDADLYRSWLAGVYLNQGRLDEAEDAARGFAGPYALFLANEVMARVHAERGKRDACEEALRGALAGLRALLRDAPADSGLYARGAHLLAALSVQPALAKELAQRAHQLSPGPQTRGSMGYAALAAGDADGAVTLLGPAADESPYSSWMRIPLGKAHRAKGDLAEARRVWREGLVINPRSRYLKLLLKGRPLPGEGLKLRDSALAETAAVIPSTAVARIAVLPMSNQTNDLKGPDVARTLFHERLSRRGYALAPLEEVDARLRTELGITDGGQLGAVTPEKLGAALGVNAVVMGTLHEFGMVNIGFAVRRRVKVEFAMLETKTGRERWRGSGAFSHGRVTLDLKEAGDNLAEGLTQRWIEERLDTPFRYEVLIAVHRAVSGFPRGAY